MSVLVRQTLSLGFTLAVIVAALAPIIAAGW